MGKGRDQRESHNFAYSPFVRNIRQIYVLGGDSKESGKGKGSERAEREREDRTALPRAKR